MRDRRALTNAQRFAAIVITDARAQANLAMPACALPLAKGKTAAYPCELARSSRRRGKHRRREKRTCQAFGPALLKAQRQRPPNCISDTGQACPLCRVLCLVQAYSLISATAECSRIPVAMDWCKLRNNETGYTVMRGGARSQVVKRVAKESYRSR